MLFLCNILISLDWTCFVTFHHYRIVIFWSCRYHCNMGILFGLRPVAKSPIFRQILFAETQMTLTSTLFLNGKRHNLSKNSLAFKPLRLKPQRFISLPYFTPNSFAYDLKLPPFRPKQVSACSAMWVHVRSSHVRRQMTVIALSTSRVYLRDPNSYFQMYAVGGLQLLFRMYDPDKR